MAVPSRAGTFGVSGSSANGQRDPARVGEAGPIPEIFNGAVFGEVNVPSSVVGGDTIEISGIVGFDCPLCVVGRQIRVVAEATHLDRTYTDEVGSLSGRGEDATFRFSLPAPQEAGQTVTVRLKAQELFPNDPTGWNTDSTAGPFDVNVVTKGQKTTEAVTSYAPWALGGGAIGVGAAQYLDQSVVGGGAVGVGAGVGAKLLAGQLQGVDLVPSFPTVPVVATAALLGAGALAVAQVRGAVPG